MMWRRFLTLLATLAAAVGVVVATPTAATAIVGGTDAIVNPGAVSIWTETPHRNRCGGVLIEPRWVLTAAHCQFALLAPDAGAVEIRTGSTDNTSGYTSVPAAAFHLHEDFNPDVLYADVMLIELAWPVPASAQQPANWTRGPPQVGSTGTIASWGWVCDGPAGEQCSSWYAGALQQMTGRLLPDGDCVTVVDPTQICFEEAQQQKIMGCPGDSGAGWYVKGFGGEWYVRAIIGGDGDDWNGVSCTTAPDGSNGLGMGTEIYPYRGWMVDVMAGIAAPGQTFSGSVPAADFALAG